MVLARVQCRTRPQASQDSTEVGEPASKFTQTAVGKPAFFWPVG